MPFIGSIITSVRRWVVCGLPCKLKPLLAGVRYVGIVAAEFENHRKRVGDAAVVINHENSDLITCLLGIDLGGCIECINVVDGCI
jgi:hypothetical protein